MRGFECYGHVAARWPCVALLAALRSALPALEVRERNSSEACAMGPFRGRIAYASYVDESLFGNPHAAAVRMAKSTPAEINDAVVIGSSELKNIGFRARSTGHEMSQKQLDRQRLHELSNSRKAKWPNTIEANRERKDKLRQEKLDAEERMRVEIDKEEEALQAEKRRLAIERANKMLYDSTDRVKALHSKLMLADVMQERERQIDLKKTLEAKEMAEDEKWYQKQQEAIRRMDAEEDLRDEEELLKRQEVAKVRNEQIEGQKLAHAARMAELRKDGEMIKQMAQADAEAEARQRLEELERAKIAHAEVVEANDYLLRAKVRCAAPPPPPVPSDGPSDGGPRGPPRDGAAPWRFPGRRAPVTHHGGARAAAVSRHSSPAPPPPPWRALLSSSRLSHPCQPA